MESSEKPFVIPTYNEVRDYFLALVDNNNMFADGLAQNFIGYNKYHNWTVKVSKTKREPMKDWKSACRTWMRNMKRYNPRMYVQMESAKIFKQ